MLSQQEQQLLIMLVSQDGQLTPEQKNYIFHKLKEPTFIQSLTAGALGAGVGLVISKFLNISKRGQILLTMAGFGIGKYLLDKCEKHDKFIQYNSRLKTYEINA